MLTCRAPHPPLCQELQHSRPWTRDLRHTNLPCSSPSFGLRLFPLIVTMSGTSALATSRTLTCRALHPPFGSDSLPASSPTPNAHFISVTRTVNKDCRIRDLGHANLPIVTPQPLWTQTHPSLPQLKLNSNQSVVTNPIAPTFRSSPPINFWTSRSQLRLKTTAPSRKKKPKYKTY